MDHFIYLDAHASTPVDREVLLAMLPYFTIHYGNGNHKMGWKSNAAVEEARFKVSSLLACRPSEIIFTSGATEAINMALLGLANASTGKNQIITQPTEHAAVLQCLESLKVKGFEITFLEVDQAGRIDLAELKSTITDKTLAVAIMLANNEIGTVQPISEIGKICKENDVRFFCDLTQGIGWHTINVDQMHIDLAAMSAHKIYGPRGVGALYKRNLNPTVALEPLFFGGGQEQGFRPGTLNVPGIVGFGKACELLHSDQHDTVDYIRNLRNHLHNEITNKIDMVRLNGCPDHRHPGNLNISIPGIRGDALKSALSPIIFSTSSACASESPQPSHVLQSIGISKKEMESSVRFGISKFNTKEEIDFTINAIQNVINKNQGIPTI